jgi:response regulator RpfG family c-di-GMP phosphodiesterase
MNNKILCVDDEPNVLHGYKRALRKDFDITIAEGGEQGIAAIRGEGPFAVVVSDMRMPGMDGVQFLSRVKQIAPETVKLMLTGNSDQQTAMDAVNEGNIFRFLTKPCPPELLATTLYAALEQYRLITAEKQLLEHTLNNSLQVMVDILALVNPTAFSRSTRVKKMSREIADQLKISNSWEVEIAAMLSQIGCITVPEEILQKITNGEPVSEKELSLYNQHPKTGRDLIARIPRMAAVAEIIANQNCRLNDAHFENTMAPSVGARILKAVLDFDKLVNSGDLPPVAFRKLTERAGWYDSSILTILKRTIEEKVDEFVTLVVGVSDLKPGMILDKPLVSTRGSLLLSAGQEITLSLILRLINFADAGIIENKIQVNSPVMANAPNMFSHSNQ